MLHAPGEAAHGLRVVRGVDHRLASSASAADRRLELVADVGDEVAADRLDPAGLGEVLHEQEHQARPQRRDSHPYRHPLGEQGSSRQLHVGLADLAVAAHLAGEFEQVPATSRSLRTIPRMYAAGLAWITLSSPSSTTPEDLSTASTSATPAAAGGGGGGAAAARAR